MSQEIEAWCSIVRDCIPELFNSEKFARQHAENYGGTVVKLTGKMPAEPIDICSKCTNPYQYCEDQGSSRCKRKDLEEELPEEGESNG